jgi:AraC-like DNA-binding protein
VTSVIDTASVPAADRFEFWMASMQRVHHPLHARVGTDRPYRGRMICGRAGELDVFRTSGDASVIARTPQDIRRLDREYLEVCAVLRGELTWSQDGRSATVRPGDVVSADSSRPYSIRTGAPFEVLALHIPKGLLGHEAGTFSRATARAARRPELLAPIAGELARGLAADGIGHGDLHLGRAIVELVRSLYLDGATAAPEGHLARAQAHIEAHIGDPGLTPEAVARAVFVSPRYLYRLFADEGLVPGAWIRERRLARCRADLLDPAHAHELVGEIAARHGFVSAAHFSRSFRARYGCSPTELRRSGGRMSGASVIPPG